MRGHAALLSALPADDIECSVTPLDPSDTVIESLTDTVIFDRTEKEHVPYRQLTFSTTEDDTRYRVVLRRCLLESEDLLESVLGATVVALSLLLVGIIMLNTVLSRWLWRPFHRTLEAARRFRLHTDEMFQPRRSHIDEFDRLNTVLDRMTTRIREDYTNLEQFTANAAHELRTPLTIILAKLEGLLDTGSLSETQQKLVADAYDATTRLSQLNRGLLLLTRIDARHYVERSQVNLSDEIAAQLDQYREFLQMKAIDTNAKLDPPLIVHMNPALATVLISTLLSNAVVHNIPSGSIDICSTGHRLTMVNTGRPLPMDPSLLFERFRKADQSSASLGLGLSIALKICESYGFTLSYESRDTRHTVHVAFVPATPPSSA
jgi:signal transduction histidine kinase